MTSIRAPQFPFNAEHLLLQGVSDYAIYMLDPEGNVASWNAGAQRIKGYTSSEIIGQNFRIFYPEEEQASGHPEHNLALALRDGAFSEEGWRVRRDGTRFWAGVVITALTYSAAVTAGGGRYVVAWGAVVFGAIQFFRGLTQLKG